MKYCISILIVPYALTCLTDDNSSRFIRIISCIFIFLIAHRFVYDSLTRYPRGIQSCSQDPENKADTRERRDRYLNVIVYFSDQERMNLPEMSKWFKGIGIAMLILGIDLIFTGITLLTLGSKLKSIAV